MLVRIVDGDCGIVCIVRFHFSSQIGPQPNGDGNQVDNASAEAEFNFERTYNRDSRHGGFVQPLMETTPFR
jgi:hypothetical protein